MRCISRGAAALLVLALAAYPAAARPAGLVFSVLTYNIDGLPWPLKRDRTQAFSRIAARLRSMRAVGRQPSIVVLQEAFTHVTKGIGVEGGYRYAVFGPPVPRGSEGASAIVTAIRSLLGGDAEKVVDSGLAVFSDYPIRAAHRFAFADCVGYDCLANKGAVLARIAMPGGDVDVVTTHLNSKRASGVDWPSSISAYERQVDALGAFLARAHDPRLPLVVAGDFNVGRATARRAYLLMRSAKWSGPLRQPVRDALGHCHEAGIPLSPGTRRALAESRDWQFFTSGRRTAIEAIGADAAFGREADGTMLSDHIGYVVRYRLGHAATDDADTKPL